MRASTTALAFLALVLAALAGGGSCSRPERRADRRAELARRIDRILARPELRASSLGVEVRRLADGDLLYAEGEERLLAPASTTKLVSCSGALAILGKDFRFETRVVRTGELASGVLKGDLVLVASGDPNLSQRIGSRGEILFEDNDHTYAGFLANAKVVPGDPLAVLAKLARAVKRAGVDRVEGAVVVDDGLFQERSDEFVGPLSAVCVNDNVIDVIVTPAARAGEAPRLQVQPAHPGVVVENHAETVGAGRDAGDPDLRVELRGGWARFDLRGTIPAGSPPVLCVGTLPDPALAAAHFLAGELEKAGVTVRDAPRRATAGPSAYAGRDVVATHISPPLSEAVKLILKVSHNLHASMLPVILGSLKGESGDRFAGYRLIHDLFEKAGLEVDRVVLRSGSGGGRADCLSARFMVSLLRHLATREEFPAFYAALPVGGVDGTLAGHFTSPDLRARVHAKTGTLVYQGALGPSWVYLSKALAGYLEVGEPREGSPRPGSDAVVFAILVANTLARTRPEGSEALFRAQEDILRAVLEVYGRGPSTGSPPTQTPRTSSR